jgi:hypothetical protein
MYLAWRKSSSLNHAAPQYGRKNGSKNSAPSAVSIDSPDQP